MRTMQEFLLWSNCTNKCKFCWQCKKQDMQTLLNEFDMQDSVASVNKILDRLNIGDDVLLVGGEILASYYESVNDELDKLFKKCASLAKEDKLRYIYLNTNLLYDDITNLKNALMAFEGIEEKLKFTTSYDVYGRFSGNKEQQFFRNLEYINTYFPNTRVVVNCIITKQLVEYDLEKIYAIQDKYPIVKYINFIPYVPLKGDRTMDVTFRDIVVILGKLESKYPGYIDHYIDDFDLNQDKRLYEYRKNQGYVECTSRYLECGHNENFTKVLNGECYICKLKEMFR